MAEEEIQMFQVFGDDDKDDTEDEEGDNEGVEGYVCHL